MRWTRTLRLRLRSLAQILPWLRAALGEIDPSVPVDNLRPLADQVSDTTTLDRMIGTLSTGFALLATLLAALGLYAVLTYDLAQRTRELGLRLALGATFARVWRMVFTDVGRIAMAGCILGAAAALALGRLAQSLLFNVPGYDGLAMLTAAGGIGLIALAAGAAPARRAAHIDAMKALRCD